MLDGVTSVSGYDADHVLCACDGSLCKVSADGRLCDRRQLCRDGKAVRDFSDACCMRDAEGNWWIPTSTAGIVKLPVHRMEVSLGRHAELGGDPGSCRDADGNTYRISSNHVFRYDLYGNTTTVYVSDMTPQVLYCDRENRVWTGTRENGLCLGFIPVEVNNVDEPLRCIYSIKQDAYGYIWLSCNLGIARLNPTDMHLQVVAGSEILPQAETFVPDASAVTADGAILFPTTNFTIKLDPSDYDGAHAYSAVADLSRIGFRNNPHVIWNTGAKTIHIPYSDNSFTLYFEMPSYLRAQGNRYRCMLSGVDKSMSGWSSEHSVSYSGLAPGRYQFTLQGMNGNGVESPQCREYTIVIDPLWWNSLAAKICYVFAALLLIVLLVLRYIRSVRAKYNERLNQARQKMESESYKQRMNFFLGMVHEIRTPMTMMRLALDKLGETKAVESREVGVINDNLNYINDTINGILNYQNNASEGTKLLMVRTDLCSLCRDVLAKASDMAALKKLQLHGDIPQMPVYVMADGIFFSKILSNLLSNALKYASTSITMSLAVEGENAVVKVNDDGPGVDPNQKEKIFGMFYKASGDKVASASGMGVGLAYARQLATEHGATLGQENLPGGGASFIVTMPLVTADAPYEAPKAEVVANEGDAAGGQRTTVLIVEDNASLCAMLEEELSAWFDICTAPNGAEALSVLEQTQVDVVVSDVMMPVMDGLELCRAVKGKTEYSHIPFIMLTAKVSVQAKAEGLESGADAYVEKPFSIPQIKAQIENLLKFREACRSAVMSGAGIEAASREEYVNKLDKEFLDKIDALIEAQIKEESFSIDALAGEMCMSKSNFYRKFHAVTGSSPNEYLKNFRLGRAAKLIMEGAKINEAAISVGFYSSSYFAKCFSARFGVLPKDYIDSVMNGKYEKRS